MRFNKEHRTKQNDSNIGIAELFKIKANIT